MDRPIDLTLEICAHRYVSNMTFKSIEIFRWHTVKTHMTYWINVHSGDALIGRSRSVACTEFLEKGLSDYMIFIDDDIMFHPDAIEKIYQELKSGKDLVGGCYPVKRAEQLASWGFEKIDGTVQKCEYVATGFMGISLRLLQKMVDKLELPLLHPDIPYRCYPFFESGRSKTPKGDNIYISEDWDFCNKAKEIGVTPYLHTGVWVAHEGPTIFTVEEAIENMKKSGGCTEKPNRVERRRKTKC